MILGIGFIMIAGIFPVAISQTASSQEETAGAASVRGAVAVVSGLPNIASVIPSNGIVVRLEDATATTPGLWSQMKGNQILQDPRYGWVTLLRRMPQDYRLQPAQVAQLIVIPVKVRNRSNFDPNSLFDLKQTNAAGPTAFANLMPLAVKVTLQNGVGTGGGDRITINSGTGAGAAVPGAVIVISTGNTAGRIYRIGASTAAGQFDLLPGNDIAAFDTSEDATGVDAWIVGQEITGAAGGVPIFGGGNMAIGVFTTYTQLND